MKEGDKTDDIPANQMGGQGDRGRIKSTRTTVEESWKKRGDK